MSDLTSVLRKHPQTGQCDRCDATLRSIIDDAQAVLGAVGFHHHPSKDAVAEAAKAIYALLIRMNSMDYDR